MALPLLFFILVSAVCLASAAGVVLSRQPVHSALFLLVNFAVLAVLYVTLEAQFLAAAQVIVYAGGIVILILFVIMLIGGSTDFTPSQRTWRRYAGLLLGVILLGGLGYSILDRIEPVSDANIAAVQGGAPVVMGRVLFTDYILPFELVGLLLLVALLGALVLGRQPAETNRQASGVGRGDTLPDPVEREQTSQRQQLRTERKKELQSS